MCNKLVSSSELKDVVIGAMAITIMGLILIVAALICIYTRNFHTGSKANFSTLYRSSILTRARGVAYAAAIRGITKFQQLVHYCRKE